MPITITRKRFEQLTGDELEAWDAVQRSTPELSSPYFRPEYLQAVAAVRPRTEVAVLREAGAPFGFFPYERGAFNIARPAGGRMTDYQGVIAAPGAPILAEDLLRACRLSGYHFNHLASGQTWFANYVNCEHDSPCIDLRGGLELFLSKKTSTRFDSWLRKRRKLIREVGPLRVDLQCRDEAVFQSLLTWKGQQYRRTAVPNVVAFGWTVDLMRRCWQHEHDDFSGWLSALYAGDMLIAADFGLRSYNLLHGWFPTYNEDFGKYAPGIVLNLELIEAAAAAGITCLDLGRGLSDYKQALMTDAQQVGEGVVSLNLISQLIHETWPQTCERLRSSSWNGPWKWLGRRTRSLRGYLDLR